MALIDLIADVTGLTKQLARIADALERAYPPRQQQKTTPYAPEDQVHYVADSPEQHHERTDREAGLANSLGVAPWSPDFQSVVTQMKTDMMRTHYEVGEDGERITVPGATEAEVEDLIRQAFREARAQENTR
jgi:hypothetical protein